MSDKKQSKLILEDGSHLKGYSFGADVPSAGEVVFNTAMTGYPENLTDPSYKGQILALTYPLIGNYGIPSMESEKSIHKFFESAQIHISGLVVSDYSFKYSHWNATKSLSDWMKAQNIPGIFGIDTRTLTKKLRERGAMLGKITQSNSNIDFYNPNNENLVAQVSIKEKVVYGAGKHKIVLVDCGVKNNIIRCLLSYDTSVIRVPWDYDFSEMEYDGLFISNGPGNPVMCEQTIHNLSKVLQKEKPIFGICLGNQLLALASGAATFKLKYGHHSHNQPVQSLETQRCYITSQNHGFAIDNDTLPEYWKPLFVNLNDGTNEGMRHKIKPFFSTQFHPEASGGPRDTMFLFHEFIKLIEDRKK